MRRLTLIKNSNFMLFPPKNFFYPSHLQSSQPKVPLHPSLSFKQTINGKKSLKQIYQSNSGEDHTLIDIKRPKIR